MIQVYPVTSQCQIFILYTTEDVKVVKRGNDAEEDLSGEAQSVGWFDDRIVSCLRQRPGITGRTRDTVREFNSHMDTTPIKHYVPSSRIHNQLTQILTTMGTEDGRGMTRRQSVEYLKWVLAELEMATIYPDASFPEFDEVEAVGVVSPKTEPATNRYGYDRWITWAVSSICDWPPNLFQGESEGDGQGHLLDNPLQSEHFIDRQRICGAALWLKLTIPGLKIAPRIKDPEHGWALHIDKLWDSGPPSRSRHHPLNDPWFLPIYRREPHQDESENFLAAPEELFSSSELSSVREGLRGKMTYNGGWGFA